jgi:hypothetical protein
MESPHARGTHEAVNCTAPLIYTSRSATTSIRSASRRRPQLRRSSRSHCHPVSESPPPPFPGAASPPCQSMATPGQFSVWQLLIMELLMVTTLPSQESPGPSKIRACSPLASRPISRICLLGFGRPPPSHPPAAAICVCTDSRCPAELPRAPPPGVLRPAASSSVRRLETKIWLTSTSPKLAR